MTQKPKVDPEQSDPVVVWGRIGILLSEVHFIYSYLRHPARNEKLDGALAKVIVFDILSILDGKDIIKDHGVDTSSLDALYRDDFKKWRRMRNDAAHLLDVYYRKPASKGNVNDPSYVPGPNVSGRRVAVYDSSKGTISTGRQSESLKIGYLMAWDVFRYFKYMLFPDEPTIDFGYSVLWNTFFE